jgi:hypothetical protein
MPDPARDEDDSWGDLYRDLGMDKPSRSEVPADEPLPGPATPADPDDPEAEPVGEERPARGQLRGDTEAASEPADADAEFATGDEPEESDEESEESGAAADAPAEEGQPGTGRKRRRRRRRRKKGAAGVAAEAPPAEVAAGEGTADEEAGEYTVTARVTEDGFADAGDDAEPDEEGGAAHLAAEEDTGSEVLRDLIANWNVPSWDDIIAGLYRPDR